MRTTCTLLAVLAALAAVQATELEDKISKSIQGFQTIMTTGSKSLNLPVLDPISIDKENLSIKVSPFKVNVGVSNIWGVGASSFDVTQLKQIDGTSKVNVALEIPSIGVTATYDITGKVQIGFISSKLSGNGPLTASIKGLKVSGVADVQEHADGSIHIKNLENLDLNIGKMHIELKNIMGGGVLGNTVNSLINTLLPSLVNANLNVIYNLAQTKGKDLINLYLDAVAGKASVHISEYPTIGARRWILTEEVQDKLNELALMIVAPSTEKSSFDE